MKGMKTTAINVFLFRYDFPNPSSTVNYMEENLVLSAGIEDGYSILTFKKRSLDTGWNKYVSDFAKEASHQNLSIF